MTLEDFQNINTDNFGEIIQAIQQQAPAKDISDYLKQADVLGHDVMDTAKRLDKLKKTEQGSSLVKVARLPVSFQKIIANRAAAFLCGNPIKLHSQPADQTETDFLSVFNRSWDSNKLDYKSLMLAQYLCTETECAELWYFVPADENYWSGTEFEGIKFRLKVLILANSKGDSLFPILDATGDMIAFGRKYQIKNGDKTEQHYDLYLSNVIYNGIQQGGGWQITSTPNPVGKIPVIYYSQDKPEWYDVQTLIERFETTISNQADTNDYFGSPMVKISGTVVGMPQKDDSGKVIQLENGADANYLTWDQSPEATKNENDLLQKLIYTLTDTPDISFENMKGLGTFSGIALKMLFMGAHLKASLKASGGFGESIQRRINYLKAALVTINQKYAPAYSLNITPEFDYFLPKNILEQITFLTDAVGAGKPIMSQESAVRMNPLVDDANKEIDMMKTEGTVGADILNA